MKLNVPTCNSMLFLLYHKVNYRSDGNLYQIASFPSRNRKKKNDQSYLEIANKQTLTFLPKLASDPPTFTKFKAHAGHKADATGLQMASLIESKPSRSGNESHLPFPVQHLGSSHLLIDFCVFQQVITLSQGPMHP